MALEHIKKQMEILRERAKKEREKRKNKNKPVRVQPKLPGMKKGGIAFGAEKRIPGSGAATKGTGFKGIFQEEKWTIQKLV